MPRAQRDLFSVSRIGVGVVGETGQIIHAGIQRQGNPLTLFKRHISLSGFNFRIVTLVDSGQHLHFNLLKAFLFP